MNAEHKAKRRRLRVWLQLTAIALLLSVAALVAGTYQLARFAAAAELESARQVELNQRIRLMQEILVALGNAETGQRGYLLTGDSAYLAPYAAAVEQLPGQLNGLSSIPMAPERIQKHVSVIRELSTLKLDELARTIQLYDTGQRATAIALVRTNVGSGYMDRLRSELNTAMDAIRLDRDNATAQALASSQAMRNLAIVAVAALIGCVALAGVQLFALSTTQRRHERELSASEQRHRAIVEEQQELVSLADENLKFTYLNPAYARHFGRSTDEMLGTWLMDFVEPADHDLVRQRLAVVFRTGQTVRGENRMVTPDGTEKWVSWTNSVQTGPNGERLLHSVGRDVTARKKAEDALRGSQDFLARTGRVAGVGGWELTFADQTMRWSSEIRKIHEVGDDFAPTLERAIESYAEEAQPILREAVRRAIDHGEPFDLELPLVTARGRRIWVRAVGEIEVDADRKPVRLVGACQDVSDRIALQSSLERQTATLRSVIETIPAMVAVLDAELRIRLVNGAFERWRGMKREDLIDKTVFELFGQEEYDRSFPWAQRALAGETVSYEKDYPTANQHRHMSVSYIPLRFEDGSVDGIITVAQDITLHRDEEKRLLNLAERDALTGVLNRAGFKAFLEAACKAGEAATLALLYIDLDRFKPVNDNHGHPVGDELLLQFAERVQRLVRPTDAVARVGGDEFAVVLRNVRTLEDAQSIADKIEDAAHSPFAVGNLTLSIGASVGVALDASGPDGPDGLVHRADVMLYQVKAAKRRAGTWQRRRF